MITQRNNYDKMLKSFEENKDVCFAIQDLTMLSQMLNYNVNVSHFVKIDGDEHSYEIQVSYNQTTIMDIDVCFQKEHCYVIKFFPYSVPLNDSVEIKEKLKALQEKYEKEKSFYVTKDMLLVIDPTNNIVMFNDVFDLVKCFL
jgi:hypothetical protein